MIGTIHNKFNTLGNSAELPYNQFVTNEVIEVGDVLFKLVSTIYVIVVGIITNDDAWILHHVLDKANAWQVRIWKNIVRVWPVDCLHKKGLYVTLQKYKKLTKLLTYV